MKKCYVAIFLLAGTFLSVSNAAEGATSKLIYKWVVDGQTKYSHIKPVGVNEVYKLSPTGLVIEDFTKDFDEVVEISIRPEKVADTSDSDGEKKSAEGMEKTAEQRSAEQRSKNCEIAKKNLKVLDGGEVYEKDAKGNMMRLSSEVLESKRKNVVKDVDYFCSGS